MDCLTQHYDAARTGWNNNEPELTPVTVHDRLSLAFSQPVDGQVYAQPLYVNGLDLPTFGARNVVFVATEAGSVYAFDAEVPDPMPAGAPGPWYWKTSLVPPGERPFNTVRDLHKTCTDLIPTVCITSTPVIDRASGTLFVTAKTIARGAAGGSHYRLHALRLSDGTPRQAPVEIGGSVPGTGASSAGGQITFNAKFQHNRPGLLLSGGTVYVAFASHCDHAPYFGWVFGYDASTLARTSIFNAAPNTSLRPVPKGFSNQAAGIWQSGIGIAADAQGFLYFQTGNGPFDLDLGGKDGGDSVLKLTSALHLAGSFTPHNQLTLDAVDKDLGSGGVMLLPDQAKPHPHQMVSCGKEGTVYLMDRAHPGGFNATTDKVLGILPNAIEGIWGGPAYYGGANSQRIYYCGQGGPLRSLSLANAKIQLLAHSPDTYPSPGTPTVSSNGAAAGTGVVWLTHVTANNTSINLVAFDADNVTNKVFDQPAGPYASGPKFTVPTVADGRVFVGTGGQLAVFALHP